MGKNKEAHREITVKPPSRAEDKPPAQGPSLRVMSPLGHSHPDESLLWLHPACTEDRPTLTLWGIVTKGRDTKRKTQVTGGSVRMEVEHAEVKKAKTQKNRRMDKMLKITGKKIFF